MPISSRPARSNAFTLAELLVVVGLVGILISLLIPAIARARLQSATVKCRSNLRQVGQHLLIYAQQCNGWIVPPRRGYEVPPEERWPMYVFKPATVTPPVMLCPIDFEPAAGISYVLNWHLVNREVRYGQRMPGGLPTSRVVIAGEKIASRDDYYLNANDYAEGLLAATRHGRIGGMNMLYLDLHVGVDPPMYRFAGQHDPWDVPPRRPP